MAIKIYKDKIEFIDGANVFTLTETTAGFDLNGTLTADSFNNVFQGTVAGYASGGESPGSVNVIDKFPFATDSNAADVGDLTQIRGGAQGQSSSIFGYTSGGYQRPPAGIGRNTIDRFPFATNANASDVGDLTVSRSVGAGQSSIDSGFTSGGTYSTFLNVIDKFPFATNANATDTGDLTTNRREIAGQSSSSRGYVSGGNTGVPNSPTTAANVNTIESFPFASGGNATDVGDITQLKTRLTGNSSDTHGYSAGGYTGSNSNTIDRFPFASNANATDVGDLTQIRSQAAGQSSFASGYLSGGTGSTPGFVNIIDKFPFATNTNATDVGDLTQLRWLATGQQD